MENKNNTSYIINQANTTSVHINQANTITNTTSAWTTSTVSQIHWLPTYEEMSYFKKIVVGEKIIIFEEIAGKIDFTKTSFFNFGVPNTGINIISVDINENNIDEVKILESLDGNKKITVTNDDKTFFRMHGAKLIKISRIKKQIVDPDSGKNMFNSFSTISQIKYTEIEMDRYFIMYDSCNKVNTEDLFEELLEEK